MSLMYMLGIIFQIVQANIMQTVAACRGLRRDSYEPVWIWRLAQAIQTHACIVLSKQQNKYNATIL